MAIPEPKRVSMPKTKGIRLEAPGCVIYIDHHGEHGALVEVIPDGNRFAGSPIMVAAVSEVHNGRRRWATREHLTGLQIHVAGEGFTEGGES